MSGSPHIDPVGGISGPKTVIDVDHQDTGTARVQHPQQGGQTPIARPVSDTRRNSDYWHLHDPSDDTRQCSLHSGYYDDDIGFTQHRKTPDQSMDTRYTHVEGLVNVGPQKPGSYDCLLSDWYIGRACAHNQDIALRIDWRVVSRDSDGAGPVVENRIRVHLANLVVEILAGSRRQDRATSLPQATDNHERIFDAFIRTENHLGAALTELPVMVNGSEPQILIREVPELVRCLSGGQVAPVHRFQEIGQPPGDSHRIGLQSHFFEHLFCCGMVRLGLQHVFESAFCAS